MNQCENWGVVSLLGGDGVTSSPTSRRDRRRSVSSAGELRDLKEATNAHLACANKCWKVRQSGTAP